MQTGAPDDLTETLITTGNGRILTPKASTPRKEPTTQVSTAVLESCMKLIREHLHSHEFDRIHEGLLLFKRTRPSRCDLCARVHDSDNTLMVSIGQDGGCVSCAGTTEGLRVSWGTQPRRARRQPNACISNTS